MNFEDYWRAARRHWGAILPVTHGATFVQQSDGAIVVVRAGRTHIDELGKALSNLEKAGASTLGVVINRIPVRGLDRVGYGYYGGGYVGTTPAPVSPDPDASDLDDLIARTRS